MAVGIYQAKRVLRTPLVHYRRWRTGEVSPAERERLAHYEYRKSATLL